MSAPDPNADDGDATERMTQNGDAEAAKRRATGMGTPRGDEQSPNDAEDGEDAFEPSERISELETLVDALQAENERLRADYDRARSVSHRKTALALAAIGTVAVLGGAVFPEVRAVLFATGATGLFGAVMTRYFTPARVLPVSVSESVYDAATTTLAGLRDELGLQPITVYVPVGDRTRGFMPRDRDFEPPENVAHAFLGDDAVSQGVSFAPSGQQLARETDRIRVTNAPDTALEAAEQVADSLVEHFEVADRITVEKGTTSRELLVEADEPAFGSLTRLDHPIVSALGCAAAQCVDEPVIIDSTEDTAATLELLPERGT